MANTGNFKCLAETHWHVYVLLVNNGVTSPYPGRRGDIRSVIKKHKWDLKKKGDRVKLRVSTGERPKIVSEIRNSTTRGGVVRRRHLRKSHQQIGDVTGIHVLLAVTNYLLVLCMNGYRKFVWNDLGSAFFGIRPVCCVARAADRRCHSASQGEKVSGRMLAGDKARNLGIGHFAFTRSSEKCSTVSNRFFVTTSGRGFYVCPGSTVWEEQPRPPRGNTNN